MTFSPPALHDTPASWSTLRDSTRAALREQQFELLESLLRRQADRLGEEHAADYLQLASLEQLFDPQLQQGKAERHARLYAWVQAMPDSCHAHRALGNLWREVASAISVSAAMSADAERWSGAREAEEKAMAYYLRALELDPRPALAMPELTLTRQAMPDQAIEPIDQADDGAHYQRKLDEAHAAAEVAMQLYQTASPFSAAEQNLLFELARDILHDDATDPRLLLPLLLADGEHGEVRSLLFSLVAHQHGLWGCQGGPKVGLFERILVMVCAAPDKAADIERFVLQLWQAGLRDAALWLAQEFAAHNIADVQDVLADLYQGRYSPADDALIDPEQSLMWRQRALANGLARARMKLVHQYHLANGYVIEDRVLLGQARALLQQSIAEDDEDAVLQLFLLMMENGSPTEALWAHDALAPSLLESQEPIARLHVATYLADFYSRDDGPYYHPRLAHAWARQALRIEADGFFSNYLHGVLKRTRGVGLRNWLRRQFGLGNRRLRADLAKGCIYAPAGFSR